MSRSYKKNIIFRVRTFFTYAGVSKGLKNKGYKRVRRKDKQKCGVILKNQEFYEYTTLWQKNIEIPIAGVCPRCFKIKSFRGKTRWYYPYYYDYNEKKEIKKSRWLEWKWGIKK